MHLTHQRALRIHAVANILEYGSGDCNATKRTSLDSQPSQEEKSVLLPLVPRTPMSGSVAAIHLAENGERFYESWMPGQMLLKDATMGNGIA